MRSYAVLLVALLPLTQAYWFWGSSGRQEAEGGISQDCIQKASDGDCHFYTCFDERHPCNEHNYALSYGWRFCTRFDSERQRFNTEGQTWIDNSRLCTMQAMLEFYEDTHINCADVEAAMKEARSKCDRDNGVCSSEMVVQNRDALLDVYTFSRHTLVGFLLYIRECGGTEMDAFIAWAKEESNIATSYLQQIQDRLSEIEWSFELPEAPEWPEIPEMPELPDLSDFEWPDLGLGWSSTAEVAAPSVEGVAVDVIE